MISNNGSLYTGHWILIFESDADLILTSEVILIAFGKDNDSTSSSKIMTS